MPIIGTAGHVDHGKSSLIRALTGRDPDRLEEEKRRGLTIDLGFAWTKLPSGTEVGFVDVPGHERFIKNMLAGIDAINVALFVVAADEGWMPQSAEHLAVIDLLDIKDVVIALTKIDRVDPDIRAVAREEIEQRVTGTVAEGSPIIEVDSIGGRGIEDVAAALDLAVAGARPVDMNRPRMWIDRAFTIDGAGTIVTGTLLGGAIRVGNTVEIYPTGSTARIRALQSHERTQQEIEPGTRSAVNLAGVARSIPHRGTMLGRVGDWANSERLAAVLRPVPGRESPNDRGAFRLHIGSGSWQVRLRMVDELVALLTADSPIPLSLGDRFILMDGGRRAVVAGGQVIDPHPPRRLVNHQIEILRRVVDGSPDEKATALLAVRGSASRDVLAAHTGGGTASGSIEAGAYVMDVDAAVEVATRAKAELEGYHNSNPLRPGMPVAELVSRLGVEESVVVAVIRNSDQIEIEEGVARSRGFGAGLSTTDEEQWQEAQTILARGLTVPKRSELGLDQELVHLLVRTGRMVDVSPDLLYLPSQIEEMRAALRGLPGEFTVADFRDHLGLTRKYAVPLLEFFDREGVTVRNGDLRRLR